jgi:hypothetical protein
VAQLDAEQVTHLAIEVGEIGLGPAAHTDFDVSLRAEPVSEDAQDDLLAGAGSAGDERKATSPASCSTRQQNDSIRRVDRSASAGTSGANGIHLMP